MRKGGKDKPGATVLLLLPPLSWYVQDLGVKVQAVVEETEVLKQSLQRLQQSSASREEVSKRLIISKSDPNQVVGRAVSGTILSCTLISLIPSLPTWPGNEAIYWFDF